MKTVKRTIGTMALAAIVMVTVSCKDGNKNEPAKPMSNEMHQETMDDKTDWLWTTVKMLRSRPF